MLGTQDSSPPPLKQNRNKETQTFVPVKWRLSISYWMREALGIFSSVVAMHHRIHLYLFPV